MNKLILALFALPIVALAQGSTNDYLFYQKPATGPLVPRAVTPTVGRLLGWPTSINSPAAITLGTGLSLAGSTLNATASSAWADLTGVPAALTTLSSATAAGLALMDDADASAQRTTLGLGTAATATLATSITGGRVPTIHSGGGLPTLAVAGFSTTGALYYFTPTGTGTPVWNTSPNLTGSTKIGAGTVSFSSLQFYDSNGGGGDNFIALRAPDYVTTDTTFILPASDGTNGQALVTNGSGTLSFATIASGATLNANTFTGLQQFSGTGHAGIRLNNLTTAERDALSSPAAGMAIWNTTDGRLQLHNGSAWTSGMVRLSGDTMTGGLTISSTTSLLLGTEGSAVGNIGFRNATSGTATLEPPTGALGTYTVTLPGVASTLATLGANTYTGTQTLSAITGGTSSAVTVTGNDASGGVLIFKNPNAFTGTTANLTLAGGGIITLGGCFQVLTGNSIGGVCESGNSSNFVRLRATGTEQSIYASSNTLTMGISTATNGATATAHTLKAPNATGTTSTGGNLTIAGGTGTSAGGSVIISTAATTTQATAVTVNKDGVTTFAKPPVLPVYTVATLPATAAAGMVQGAHAVVTDATAPTYLGALTGGGAVVCPVFYNGTAWVSH
jgi:hypothetical protein